MNNIWTILIDNSHSHFISLQHTQSNTWFVKLSKIPHVYLQSVNNFKFRKIPNAEHSMAGHEIGVLFSLRAFFLSVITVSKNIKQLYHCIAYIYRL
jgi:hypothetical protein